MSLKFDCTQPKNTLQNPINFGDYCLHCFLGGETGKKLSAESSKFDHFLNQTRSPEQHVV